MRVATAGCEQGVLEQSLSDTPRVYRPRSINPVGTHPEPDVANHAKSIRDLQAEARTLLAWQNEVSGNRTRAAIDAGEDYAATSFRLTYPDTALDAMCSTLTCLNP